MAMAAIVKKPGHRLAATNEQASLESPLRMAAGRLADKADTRSLRARLLCQKMSFTEWFLVTILNKEKQQHGKQTN